MAASFFVNAMQVNFISVLTMENSGMVRIFKSLEGTRLKGFWRHDSVNESAVVEFFANAKVIAGTIISFIDNRKLALAKDVFVEVFLLPTEGMTRFLDIPKETVVEMRSKFSGSDVPFRAPTGGDKELDAGEIEVTKETNPVGENTSTTTDPDEHVEKQAGDTSTVAIGEEHMDNSNRTEMEPVTNEGAIVIDPAAKVKGMFEDVALPNPVEEHCQLMLKTAWEDVSSRTAVYDEWVHLRTMPRGTAAAGAQRSSLPVGTKSSGPSPAPFKPSEPRGSACSIF
ncbi:zinc finger CCCH domain-containing protein 64-like [Dorcoceras hygrometricum]|uniref:Zinc finger CCCH domain-containing protein 64-like n=1 Tax=Dorcoceras hygrometricum TaxID=472368 RepID=A0A2Z7BXA1_9LAMI|nr:zinc finger CCCH domain-containing protein 64-like [Dorcoceras hygrometricum]